MAYTEKEFNYYIKKPKQIHSHLDEDLLLALVDVNSSWFSYMKPHTLEMVKKVMDIDPSTFQYADRTVFTIQYLEETISKYPMLIQYVYEPNDTLIEIALTKDLNVLQYLKNVPIKIKKNILKQNGLFLNKIPVTEQTEELVEIAIRQNVDIYEFAGVKNLYLDKIVLSIDPSKINLISDYHDELILDILNYNPRLITQFVGRDILTEDLKKIAIDKDPSIFLLFDKPSVELTKYAITKDLTLMDNLPYNQEVLDYALTINGLALKYVRKKDLRTIREAVEMDVMALKYVDYPRSFLIDYAFERNGLAIQFIENPTDEQYMNAIKRDGRAIEFIPENKQNKQIQSFALASAGTDAIPFITKPADDDIILEMIRKDASYIFKLDNPTDTMYSTAFSTTGQLMLFFEDWEEKFNNEIIISALTQDGTILEFVKSKNKAMINAAIKSFPASIQWVENQDIEMAKLAVEYEPKVLFYIDKTIMDDDLLALAVKLDPDFFTIQEGELTWEQWLERINK